jgi:hypothetical protein
MEGKKANHMKRILIFTATVGLLTLAACGNQRYDNTESTEVHSGTDTYEPDNVPAAPQVEKTYDEQMLDPQQGTAVARKLIKTGQLRYEAHNLAREKAKWVAIVQRWQGYISSEQNQNYEDERSTSLTLRVPAVHFDSVLLQGTQGISVFDRRQIDVSDVTDEFVDIAARLKTKKELEARYRELLKMAKTVSEVLEIEREMGSLRADIESIEGRLNVLSNQIAFSTLEVTFYETTGAGNPFGKRLGKAFVSGWDNLLSFISGLIHIWPFLLLAAGLVFTIVRVARRKR